MGKRPKLTKQQKAKLLEMINNAPELKYGGLYGKNNALKNEEIVEKWKEVAKVLNGLEKTVQKEWHGWRKTWVDLRTKIRRNLYQNADKTSVNGFDEEYRKYFYTRKIFCDDSRTNNSVECDENDDNSSLIEDPSSNIDESDDNIVLVDKDEENSNVKSKYDKKESTLNDELEISLNGNENALPEKINFHGFKHSVTDSKKRDHSPKLNFKGKLINEICGKRKPSSFKESIKNYLNREARVKEDYYTKKLRLLERDVVAKETIASSLRLLVEGRSDLF